MEIHRILVRPMVTEKSNLGPQDGKYTFRVHKKASKAEIKAAVEEQFKVKVVSVNTSNFIGKSRSKNYRSTGKLPNWKKAIVTLAKGETIPELYEDLG